MGEARLKLKGKFARFEAVTTFAEVEAFQLGVCPSEGVVFLQMKMLGVEFPSLVVLESKTALGLAAHLTAAATAAFQEELKDAESVISLVDKAPADEGA